MKTVHPQSKIQRDSIAENAEADLKNLRANFPETVNFVNKIISNPRFKNLGLKERPTYHHLPENDQNELLYYLIEDIWEKIKNEEIIFSQKKMWKNLFIAHQGPLLFQKEIKKYLLSLYQYTIDRMLISAHQYVFPDFYMSTNVKIIGYVNTINEEIFKL